MSRINRKDGFVDIQDLYGWRNHVAGLIGEYAGEPGEYEGYVLAIYPSLEVLVEREASVGQDADRYDLRDFVWVGEDGDLEVDYDKVRELSERLMFVR